MYPVLRPLGNLGVVIIIPFSLMDQEALLKARGWKCFPQAKTHFLEQLCLSSMHLLYPPPKSHKKCYHCTESLMTQLHLRNLSNSLVLRERRGWGRIGFGPYPSLYTGKNILLPWAGYGDFSGHFLKGCLVWCCHFLGSRPLLYCSDAPILFIPVCVWMLSPSLVV